MKSDLYTKVVLTVIALCLLLMVINKTLFIPKENSNSSSPNFKGNINHREVLLNEDGTLDVNIKSISSSMEVIITDIKTSDNLNVNVNEVGGFWVGGTSIPVIVK